jgi:hypothetical protein
MDRGGINNFAGVFCSDSQKKCMCRSEEGPAGLERPLDRVTLVLGREVSVLRGRDSCCLGAVLIGCRGIRGYKEMAENLSLFGGGVIDQGIGFPSMPNFFGRVSPIGSHFLQ